MDMTRRSSLVYALLAGVWALMLGWQAEEHFRFREAAKADLSNRSRDIANTVSACIRGMRFFGTVRQERLEPLLTELVNGRTNQIVKASELLSIVLLNAAGERIATAGRPIDFSQNEVLQQGERWGQRSVTFVNPVDLGASLITEGGTNPTVVLPLMQELTNNFREGGREGRRRNPGAEPGPEPPPPRFEDHGPNSNAPPALAAMPPPPGEREREGRMRDRESRLRRPPWLRMTEEEFHALVEKRGLHGLVLAMSTDAFQAAGERDLWLRLIIVFSTTLAVLGAGLAWRNVVKSSDLQIRLVRASELTTHLREMNLAAAGLAHETRNPLNIIRGRAQMISKLTDTPAEIQERLREIVDEADKVAAQLNEFINYSRPRELRPARLALGAVIGEVARALGYDLEEKKIRLEVKGEQLLVEADDQLLRQALFNLILNATQAVEAGGEIQVYAEKQGATEAVLEVRDNGPGVPPERRVEIFKPYFTTQKQGTGLGLAVVQQIVMAHGWEIQCLPNEPRGARFRITHLKLAAA